MVTEGYKGCRTVQKHRFLRCFGPFGLQEFSLGTVTKPRVLRGFGVQGRARKEKNDKLKVFQHKWATFVVTMAQHRAKIGPTSG